jgi:choline dehydrogenase
VPLCYSVPIDSSIHILRSHPITAIKSLFQYILFGTGLFLSPVTEYTYFLRSDRIPPYPALETENAASYPESLADLELSWVGAWGTIEEAMPEVPKSVGFNTILVQVIRPKSEGTITLVDRDARNPPIVDPNYLAAEVDFETMRKGVQCGIEIGRMIMEKSKDIVEALVPKGSSTEAVDEFIRKYTTGSYHLSSTCRMAQREDDGVVDQSLRVYGVRGLRVADASIFPKLIGVKPQATVALVAQKCAELISTQS